MKSNSRIIQRILFLQAIVVLYSLAGVFGKLASEFDFLSFPFIGFYGLEIAVLGCYAILWQQVIKRIPLSIAYANRSTAMFWSMIWAVLLFHDSITLWNAAGILIIFLGVFIVNSCDAEQEGSKDSQAETSVSVQPSEMSVRKSQNDKNAFENKEKIL